MAQLIANPVAGANSPCDGPVNEVGQDATFATIVAASGNQGGLESTSSDIAAGVNSSTTTNQFAGIHRAGFNFDTSSLGVTALITAATFSIVCNTKTNNLGSDSYSVVAFTPASTASIPASAFTKFGSIAFATIAYASLVTTGGYTDFVLNAAGLATINQTGISSFGLRSEWDRSGVFGGTWASSTDSRINIYYADNGSNKPKLTVTYLVSSPSLVASVPQATFKIFDSIVAY